MFTLLYNVISSLLTVQTYAACRASLRSLMQAPPPGDGPPVELCEECETPAELEELSAVSHSLHSLRQVARLSSFTGLRRLVLHGGLLTRLDGLDAVAFTLEELNVSGNALQTVHCLGSMPKLRVLNLVRHARCAGALRLTRQLCGAGEQPAALPLWPGGPAAPGEADCFLQPAGEPGRPRLCAFACLLASQPGRARQLPLLAARARRAAHAT